MTPDDAQHFAEFMADQVLAAITTGHGQVSRVHVEVIGQIADHPGILVIRVGCDIQHIG